MKVMMLVHGLGVGGAEAMICHVASHLRDRGADVEIGCLGELGRMGEELQAAGADVVVHRRKPGFDASLPLRLARRLRQGRFDVAHAHQRTALVYTLLAGVLAPTPLVYTEHGLPLEGGSVRKQRAFNRMLGWRLQRITAVSDALKRELVECEGLVAANVEIIPNGVDVDRFAAAALPSRAEARRRIGLPLQARVLGSVGRLEPVKNPRLLLYVIERLCDRVPDLHLVLVGDGAERPGLESMARLLHLEDRVHLLGTRRDVELILPALDVFCLSSRSEGTPLSLLEAMAAGVPTVATFVGGVPEIVRSEQEGLLVAGMPPDATRPLAASSIGYVDAFADAVERLLSDEDLRRHVVGRALARSRDFAVDAICRRYAAVLVEAARSSPRCA